MSGRYGGEIKGRRYWLPPRLERQQRAAPNQLQRRDALRMAAQATALMALSYLAALVVISPV